MKNKLNLLLSILFLSSYAIAQNTLKEPTLEHLMPGGSSYIYTENVYGLDWWGDQCIKPEVSRIVLINPTNGEESTLVDLATINDLLTQNQLAELTHLYNVKLAWPNESKLYFTKEGKLVLVDWNTNSVEVLLDIPEKAENLDFNAQTQDLAYTVDNDLWMNGMRVTENPEGHVAGQTTHRSEFGISKGTFWSNSGNLLAFYNTDESMVTKYPLVNIQTRIASLENIRYPMAGMNSHKVRVGIFNPDTQKTVYLKTGDPTDRYFTNISWSPNDKSIYLIEENRDQNHAKLCQYNATTGELINVLYEEKHDKYVEFQKPIAFLPWNANQFILQSQRDGFNHLYLFDINGEELKQLTRGEWLVKDLIGFNAKNKEVFIKTTKNSPLQSNTYAVSIKNSKLRALDNQKGVHNPKLNKSGTYFIDSFSSTDTPRTINIVSTKTGKIKELLSASNPYDGFKMPTIEVGTIKAADGNTDLYYRIVKPKDLDTSKKYPAIVYVYGGPHAQMINASYNYGVRGWDIYMANKGYIVYTLDNRGSSNRGIEFENATFRELGIKEGEDQVEGVKYLESLGYVDMDRIGVHGWSFGGHMTTALMLRYPEIYKVGVSGGAVIDWSLYEIMYGERYMDTPQTNPEGYKKTNLRNIAGQLKGHLLMIHDDHDPVCVPQHTLSFIQACINARTYPDLFIYPNHQHNVIGKDRVHLYEKITRYFDDYL